MDRRDRSPESSWWATEAGRTWLRRLLVATLCVCGLTRGVGAETRSELFGRLRLEAHGGCAPRALRTVRHTLERLVLEAAAAWEQAGIAHGERRPGIGAVDETCLQRLMLVCMDLSSGAVLLEEVVGDRRFDTWDDRANARLTTLGTAVLSLVRDRAKARSTLAHTGLGCPSLPEVVHVSHALAKGYALCIFGRLRHAKRDLDHARQRLETVQKNAQGDRGHVTQAQTQVAAWATSVYHWQGVGSAWRQRLAKVSRLLHPWRLADSLHHTSKEAEEPVRAALKAIDTWRETNGLPMKQDLLDTVRTQRVGLAALVDLWWQTVRQA